MTQLPAKVLTANRPGVQYLKAARVKREKYPGAGNAKVPGDFEHSATLPGTIAVIRRFNRETEALAAIVVSAVVSTALLFAVLFQDRHPKSADLTEEARETGGYLLPNDNLRPGGASLYEQMVQINSGQATSVDHAFARLFDKQLNNRMVHAP